jgi:hypothetical protein
MLGVAITLLIQSSLIQFSLVLVNSHTLSRMLLQSMLLSGSTADHVKLLGLTLDYRLPMNKHVNGVSRVCFHHLQALRHIQPAVTISDTNVMACSLGGPMLNLANAVLYTVSTKNMKHLQRLLCHRL